MNFILKTMDKLISNTDFGFYVRSIEVNDHKKLELRENFDLFLKQDLNIGMFVPAKKVDGVWVVLEDPKGVKCCAGVTNDCFCHGDLQFDEEELKECQEAKENVLFEGFNLISGKNAVSKEDKERLYYDIYFDKGIKLYDGKDIFILNSVECLVNHSVELTESAKKQIGL